MSKRSRSSRGSNPITCWSVTHWASTPRGMPCPQAKKTTGTFRPLERGIQCFYNVIYGFPGEPPEEYERMADTVASLTHLQAPNTPVRLRLDRFSPYHYNPDNFGIEI